MKTNKTNKVSFTPGPWEIEIRDNESNKEQVSICSNDGETLAYINKYEDSVLIAAAPEMFDVLQLIGTIANVGLDTNSDYKNRMKRISEHATKILKKARGE